MTQEDAFLQEVLENPADDVPRRVYADWLVDQGGLVNAARGEFIQIQCDLARLPLGARPAELVRRERELLEVHGREWGSLFGRLGCSCWQFRRGFVEGVGVSAPALLSQAATLFRAAPVSELKVYQSAGLWAQLSDCVHLARLRCLDLESNGLTDDDLEALCRSANLPELVTLHLWANRIGDAGVRALVRSAPPKLTRLDLSSNQITDAGALVLADSTFLSRLRLLDLSSNQINDAGALAVIGSPHVSAQAWLELSKNPITIPVQNALREWHARRAG